MKLHTDTPQDDTKVADTRVLALIEEPMNATFVSDWVGGQSGYQSVDATDKRVANGRFDICLFDRAGYEAYERQLHQVHQRTAAGIQPLILVLQAGSATGDCDWPTIDSEFDGIVDDVLLEPLRAVDVQGTVERNLTLHRETEQHHRTRQRLEQFERTVDAMDHAVYITDTDGTIEFVNPAFTAVTGYEAADAIGKTPAILKSGYHDEEYYRRLWVTISAGEVWIENVVNERKNGERYHAEQTIVPVTDDEGRIQNYVAVQTDITERAIKTQHLEVLDRILRHDLRNDMNVIQARAELLERQTSNGLGEHVAEIQSKARDLVATADKEREIVRLLLNTQSTIEQNISRVLRRTVDQVQIDYPDAAITATIPDGVRADASPKFDRAIEELLVNAIVHNDGDKPTIDVTLHELAEGIEITVADNGPGIPDPELAVLKGEDSLDPLFHGSGLGLWLVYWIIRFSEGTLDVTENDSRGSVITLQMAAPGAAPKPLKPDDVHLPPV